MDAFLTLMARDLQGSALPTGAGFLLLAQRQYHFRNRQYHLKVALHDGPIATL
jgi:hypothetical protein